MQYKLYIVIFLSKKKKKIMDKIIRINSQVRNSFEKYQE